MFKKHIPNLLTLGNLSLGCLAILFIVKTGDYQGASLLILIAALLDFLDGFVARLLKVSGELGKQLDSLADMVSFGVVPAALAWSIVPHYNNISLIILLIPALSAMRLAIFNIADNQSDDFVGVPTPMNTLGWIGFVYAYHTHEWFQSLIHNHSYLFLGFVIISALLLVVRFPMIAIKFKKLDKRFWFKILIFVLPSAAAIITLGVSGLFVVYLHYLVSSVLYKFAFRN